MIFRYILTALSFFVLSKAGQTSLSLQRSVSGSAFIEFKCTEIKFGKVWAGKKITENFIFRNSGTDTLFIKTVQASDGGTIAYWPAAPIPPGVQDTIKVIFGFTELRRGYQDKEFTVLSNAQNNPVVLHLKGIIKKKE